MSAKNSSKFKTYFFIILTILSFFMTKFLLNSPQDFMTFFEEKWLLTLAVVIVFVGYKHFFSKRK